jgi:hypothetical protein
MPFSVTHIPGLGVLAAVFNKLDEPVSVDDAPFRENGVASLD